MAKALAFPGLCRLQVDSTSQVSLQRFQGAWIPMKIGGAWVASLIPTSGTTLSNSGLTAATLYYVYAFDSAGTQTLEAVVTAPATDTDTGIRIKTGDATRTLVGMVFMDAGSPGTFVDSATKRWCLNHFNRRSLHLLNAFTADRTTTSTTYVEVNTEIRCQFLAWADEAVWFSISGDAQNAGGGQASYAAIGIDNTTPLAQASGTDPSVGGKRMNMACTAIATLSEGSHYATLLGAVSGGTATYASATNTGNGDAKVELHGLVRG